MVTLKEYIKQTLKDIREARDEEKSFDQIRGTVDFDVATLAVKTGGAGMEIGVLGIGGEFGGKLSNQVTSRIRFSVQTKGAIHPASTYQPGKGYAKDI